MTSEDPCYEERGVEVDCTAEAERRVDHGEGIVVACGSIGSRRVD